MPHNTDTAVQMQRRYYAETAAEYDAMHVHEGDDNPRTLKWVCSFCFAWLRLKRFWMSVPEPDGLFGICSTICRASDNPRDRTSQGPH